jgi:hypothetical protein
VGKVDIGDVAEVAAEDRVDVDVLDEGMVWDDFEIVREGEVVDSELLQ